MKYQGRYPRLDLLWCTQCRQRLRAFVDRGRQDELTMLPLPGLVQTEVIIIARILYTTFVVDQKAAKLECKNGGQGVRKRPWPIKIFSVLSYPLKVTRSQRSLRYLSSRVSRVGPTVLGIIKVV